jgi:hypothetical protein
LLPLASPIDYAGDVNLARPRQWLYPVLVLCALAIAVFGGLYSLDRYAAAAGSPLGYFRFSANHITDSVGSLASMIAAVLGIIITVVSIVVQLSAERYAQVTQMFFRDRTNRAIMGFYVVGCMCGIFVSFSLSQTFVPRVSVIVMLVIAMLAFAAMAPYFAYVFDFLQPENIIGRIRIQAMKAATEGQRGISAARRAELQATTLSAMEQLTDVTINSIEGKDKIIATAGVDALKDLAVTYLEAKANSAREWFAIGPGIRQNPDFVSMAPESVDDLAERKTWVEFKVLRQYQAIYHEALASMGDINYVIAIDTRYIGEAAILAGDKEALSLCVKFFNTYMRATLNAKNVRTAYNILNQYRLLCEAILRGGLADKAVEVVGYIKYYGHVSYSMKLGFVTETVAYDLCALCELAHELASPVEKQLLASFLEVDQPATEGEGQETGLRGVRKAQVKLATYYLTHDAERMAREIYEDMKSERPERLRSIREELSKIESKDFWEVIDRGTNFDYLPPERKAALEVFFGWFPRLVADVSPLPMQAK